MQQIGNHECRQHLAGQGTEPTRCEQLVRVGGWALGNKAVTMLLSLLLLSYHAAELTPARRYTKVEAASTGWCFQGPLWGAHGHTHTERERERVCVDFKQANIVLHLNGSLLSKAVRCGVLALLVCSSMGTLVLASYLAGVGPDVLGSKHGRVDCGALLQGRHRVAQRLGAHVIQCARSAEGDLFCAIGGEAPVPQLQLEHLGQE
eukprot:1138489-Pelagomonas_calceolata.AAC.2